MIKMARRIMRGKKISIRRKANNILLKEQSRSVSWSIFFQVLCGVGIPVVLGMAIFLSTQYIENAKVETDYIRIALGILSDTNMNLKNENSAQLQEPLEEEKKLIMRQWAIKILDKKSPVKFSDTEKESLLKHGLPRSVTYHGVIDFINMKELIKSRTDELRNAASDFLK